ncbi:MAG: hypothetical protein LLG14_19630 [Nocardiaceae bacterium]|nr:hypothetical protein [Nocardiaceae bacterium]
MNTVNISELSGFGLGSTVAEIVATLEARDISVRAFVSRSDYNTLSAEHRERQRAEREAAAQRAAREADAQEQRRTAALVAQWRAFDTEATCHRENIAFETYLRDEKYAGPGDIDYDDATRFIEGLAHAQAEAERHRDEIAAQLHARGAMTPLPHEPRKPLPAHLQLLIQNGDA